MFIELQCCQKCFTHKQYNHNEWVFHDNFCKLDQTIQRKCKLKTLKNLRLPPGILQELEHYDFAENEIIDHIVQSQKEKIKPDIETFEIRYKGVYVFSLGETKTFPDYNLVAKLLLAIKKAEQSQIIILNKDIRIAGFLTMYELVKIKNHNISEKNIKLKSIQDLIPQKEFRRTQVSSSKEKRSTHNLHNIHRQVEQQKTKKDPTSFEQCLFKQRPQNNCVFKQRPSNHYVFKLRDGSNTLLKPSTAQNAKSIGRGSEKIAGKGSLPKISCQQLAAKKRQQKRIRCKKFSNRYSSMTKKCDIINKMVMSQYGRIKEENFQFLSKDSDLKGDKGFSEDFELQELSDSSEEQNIFKNGSNFTRISCIELLNELCKAEERPRKFDQAQQNNLGQIQSTQSIDKKERQPRNEFEYQFDSGDKLAEYDQIDFNITQSMKDNKIQYSSSNLLEPIRETQDDKWENNSFNSSAVNQKFTQKNSVNASKLNESIVGQQFKDTKKESNRVHKLLADSEEQRQTQSTFKEKVHQSQKSSSSSRHEKKENVSKQEVMGQNLQQKVNCKKSSLSQHSQKQNQSQCQQLNQSRFKCQDHSQRLHIQPNQKILIQPTQLQNSLQSSSHQTSLVNDQPQKDLINQKQDNNNPQPMLFEGARVVNRFSLESRHSQTEENDVLNEKYPWESSPRQRKSDDSTNNHLQGEVDHVEQANTHQNSPLYDYFSTNLNNFTQKLCSFHKTKSSASQNIKPLQTTEVQQFLTFVYPCPKILLETKNKKKISRIIQNLIDPYLQLVSQSQKQHKQWVELTQTNVCKIFLLQKGQNPKQIQTILWNRLNPMDTKLYITKPQAEIQTFIELGQLHKEYNNVLFLFYDHNFQLHQLPFKILSRKLAISQKQKCNRKYSVQVTIGDKYVAESEQAKNEPNHIFIAFEAKDNNGASSYHEKQSKQAQQKQEQVQQKQQKQVQQKQQKQVQQKQSKQVQQKLKAENIEAQSELQIRIQVYQSQKGQQLRSEQGLIGTIEKKGKFFFELNLQKGAYKFDISIKNIDFDKVQGNKLVQLLFYSQAEVRTSEVKELFE